MLVLLQVCRLLMWMSWICFAWFGYFSCCFAWFEVVLGSFGVLTMGNTSFVDLGVWYWSCGFRLFWMFWVCVSGVTGVLWFGWFAYDFVGFVVWVLHCVCYFGTIIVTDFGLSVSGYVWFGFASGSGLYVYVKVGLVIFMYLFLLRFETCLD